MFSNTTFVNCCLMFVFHKPECIRQNQWHVCPVDPWFVTLAGPYGGGGGGGTIGLNVIVFKFSPIDI